MKGVTLCTKFALAGLGPSSFSSFCKKWYYTMRWSDEKRKKKQLATVIVGLFSLEKRRLKIIEEQLFACVLCLLPDHKKALTK